LRLKDINVRFIPALLLTSIFAGAQQVSPARPERTSPWFNAQAIDFVALTSGPPAAASRLDKQDMDDVMLAQRIRTTAQIQQAQADDKEEDIFIFASVLGSKFNAAELPLTAALSQHLRDASAVINPPLKLRFGRPRPFTASARVHPVCQKTASGSFPSGHAMVGTLEALALTQIVPERSPEILRRLDQYTHNRIVCGVHYPSDVAASRMISSALFGLIAASPVFQQELTAVKMEVRSHLAPSATSAASASRISNAVNLAPSAAVLNEEDNARAK
jgi:acid phosphatase (class A)